MGSLSTRGQILSEMGRVFRETRRGKLTPTDGKALASVLQGMAAVVKDGEAEQIMQKMRRCERAWRVRRRSLQATEA